MPSGSWIISRAEDIRRELIIAMEEWLARAPIFRVKEGAAVPVDAGGLYNGKDLPLVWR